MRHCKIKCKKETEYEKIKSVLDIVAIEYYQNKPDKPIHLCGFEKKEDIEKILGKYGLKKFKVKVEEPDFDKVEEEARKEERKNKRSIMEKENSYLEEQERDI